MSTKTKTEIIMSFVRAKIAGPAVNEDDLSHLECLIDFLPETLGAQVVA
jgi:hypothetical protein